MVPSSVFNDVVDDLDLGFSPELAAYGAGQKIAMIGSVPKQVGDLASESLMEVELTKYAIHADILILRFEKGGSRKFLYQGFEFDIGYFGLDTAEAGRTAAPRRLLSKLGENLRSNVPHMLLATYQNAPTFAVAYRTMDEADIKSAGLMVDDGAYAGAKLSVEQVVRANRSEIVWHELLCHAVPGATGRPFLHQPSRAEAVPAALKLSDKIEAAIDRIVRKTAISRLRSPARTVRSR
jgi:hypothetical protein